MRKKCYQTASRGWPWLQVFLECVEAEVWGVRKNGVCGAAMDANMPTQPTNSNLYRDRVYSDMGLAADNSFGRTGDWNWRLRVRLVVCVCVSKSKCGCACQSHLVLLAKCVSISGVVKSHCVVVF